MCGWPPVHVIAIRNRTTHRGTFLAVEQPIPKRLLDNTHLWESRQFDLVRDWVKLCNYFDGWTCRDMACAIGLRGRLFEKNGITAIGVVIYDYEALDE
jgi:hypothetical protein